MKHKYSSIHIFICSALILALVVIGNIRLSAQSNDPIVTMDGDSTSYIFELQLDGVAVAEYDECSGLGSSNDILETETGPDAGGTVIVKTPGVFRWSDITLRRTGVIDEAVWAWRKATQNSDAEQAFRDGAIVMRTADGNSEVARWTFKQGWAASLNLNGLVEELTIVHEGLEYTADTTQASRTGGKN